MTPLNSANPKIDAPIYTKLRSLNSARFLDASKITDFAAQKFVRKQISRARRADHILKDVVSGRHNRHRKAQAWGFDMMVASLIFITGIIIFYIYAINYPKESQETLDKLFNEGEIITEMILSRGLPDDWNENNVVRIGLTSEDKINETKLERFYALADSQSNPLGYVKAKSALNTRYNFFMNFSQQMVINGRSVAGIGNSFEGQSTKNIIKITRATIYQNKIVSLNLYLWE